MVKVFLLACFILLFVGQIQAIDIPIQILKASEIYRLEREKIKTYRVEQEIITKTTDRITSETHTEKRRQSGFFVSPNKYYFVIKEKNVNGVNQEVYGNFEKAERTKNDWLSKTGLVLFRFQVISDQDDLIKYSVTPKNKNSENSEMGEIWLDLKNSRIKKIIQKPTKLKKGIKSYRLELDFEDNFEFQEPTASTLEVVIQQDGIHKEIKVQAKFRSYEFNILVPSSLLKQ